MLNRKVISRYMGEFKRVVKDKPYSIEQIQQALTNADPRMRMVILILSSTACRIGSLCDLTLSLLTDTIIDICTPPFALPDYRRYHHWVNKTTVIAIGTIETKKERTIIGAQ